MTIRSNAGGHQICDGRTCTCDQPDTIGRRDGCGCGTNCTCTTQTCGGGTRGTVAAMVVRAVTVMAVAGLALGIASPARAQSDACGTATLMNVEIVAERIPQSTITSVRRPPADGKRAGERRVDAYTTPSERQTRTYRVTVRLGDMVYTGQSSGDWFWEFDPTRLVINDAIHVCVAADRLRLRRPDGKDYKVKIVRVVRESAVPAEPERAR